MKITKGLNKLNITMYISLLFFLQYITDDTRGKEDKSNKKIIN